MFEMPQFNVQRPQTLQSNVIQQQAPEKKGGGLLGSLLGMGLNYLMPGMGSLATGLISGNPQAAIGGVAEMAGLGGAGATGAAAGAGGGQQPGTPTSQTPGASQTTGGSDSAESENSPRKAPGLGEQQKIDDPNNPQGAAGQTAQVDPSQQLQQLLSMMYLQQMFQGMNPSMNPFQMPHSPVQGINPNERSPISGGIVGV